jgi:hypothetical protein
MEDYNNFYQDDNQEEDYSPVPQQKSKKILLLLIPVFVIIVGGVIFLFMNSSSEIISDTEFSQGITLLLKEDKEAKFVIDNEEHTIKVNSVGSDSVNLIIQSNPIQVDIKVGEEKKFDLDEDGFYDIQIKLKNINDGIPEIYIKKIYESSYVETSIIVPDDIILDIILPKLSYEIDEEVNGDYYLKYQGVPFKGAVISCDHSGCSKAVGMIDDIDFNDPAKINYLKSALKDTFYYNGTYTYSIYLYDCKDIEAGLNVDGCGGSIQDNSNIINNILEGVTPLKSKSKSIIVTGENEEYEPECTNNDDCTQTCTNCDDGSYVCAYSSDPLINKKCVECINYFSCKDGYGCVDNICIVEECGPNHLDLCLDETTCTNAEGYWYNEECNGVEQVIYTVTNPDTILDCYNEDFSEILCSPEDAIGFGDLFEDRLGSCEISEGTFALGWEPIMGIFRGYEIQDEQGSDCIVKFWFLENSVIDSNLLNKQMICEYDSSKRTIQDVGDCFEDCCSGELVDAINEI